KNVDRSNGGIGGSLIYEGESRINKEGKSKEMKGDIASMYVSLGNNITSQYGKIGSIRWLTTGYKGDLMSPKQGCFSVFGGDVFISRHTFRRPMPLFLTTAMNQADLTPFDYKIYSNIGDEP